MSLWTCLCFTIVAIILAPVSSEGDNLGCSITQHGCDNGRCIPIKWRCDQDDDCGDGSDETDCAPVTCSDTEFQCDNGHCILKRWLCDNEDDCKDGSDENQAICANNTCKEDQFQCGVGGECIPMNWQCDGHQDCTGGEDEKSCAAATCPEEMFMCTTSNHCITNRWRCDQDKDCDDGSDEEGCEETPSCEENEFRCNSTDRCIPGRWRCDGDVDCKDGSDENSCPSRPPSATEICSETEFTCSNFECIHKAWKCDGDEDCTDGSDEVGCGDLACAPDQFRCKDQCIHGSLQCDGHVDCNDGEDEEGCTPAAAHCDPETQFDCSKDGKLCIPIEKLCDQKNDCGNYEDEPSGPDSFCNVPNPCLKDNGGCKHHCHYNKYAPHWCTCNPGYELDKDKRTCNDINECLVPGTCSQGCDNVRGGYKCSCLAGYTLDPKGRYCRAGGREPYLLFANRHDLREIRLDSGDYRAVVAKTRSAIAIDFDYEDNYVYWSDVAQESILRARYNHTHSAGSNHTEAVVTDLTTPDGIAVDWLHKLLYWTDTGRNTIEVVDLSAGHHRLTLFNTDLDEPRSIMVDPRADQGWIYWTDWGYKPKIERAGMDGNHRQAIVTSELQWPNGMTIDYVSNKLFWVDAKLHTIMSSNLDGSAQGVILSDRHYLSHPFSISVFEDTLYWTDWQTESIHKTNKFNGSAVSNVAISLFSPMDIHVFHELKQPKDSSRCSNNNGGCSHFCLPSPMITSASARYSCACPNGWDLDNNGRTCTARSSTKSTDAVTSPTKIDKNLGPNSSAHDKEQAENPIGKSTSESGMGKMAVIISGVLGGVALFAVIIGYIIYRSILRKNVQSMNFDNPVYRKTTEDQFSLEKNQFQPSRLPATLEPLTAGQTEEV